MNGRMGAVSGVAHGLRTLVANMIWSDAVRALGSAGHSWWGMHVARGTCDLGEVHGTWTHGHGVTVR